MHSNPLGPSEKILFAQKYKEIAICAILREKPHFEAFPEAKKGNWRSQLHAQRSKMHSNPLGPSEKKILLYKSTRKARYVRSLGKKKPILGYSQRLKKVLHVLRCAKNAPQRPQKLQIPRGYQKKKFIVYKVCEFVDKVEILVLRGVGVGHSKKC